MAVALRQLLDNGRPSRESLGDRAYAEIRRAIVDLTLRPGESIAESTLAQWLGMSRTPVREALLRLRFEKWVYVVPRKGLFVSRIAIKDLREIYEVIEGLEVMIARLVVERATDEDIARLSTYVERMEAVAQTDDRPAWLEADLGFHGLLSMLADNERIREIHDRFDDQLERVVRVILWLRPWPTASTAEHRALYEAIRRRDADTAMVIAQAHRGRTRAEFISLLTEQVPDLIAI